MTRPSLYQIFLIFLQLGCFSFGGPAAHLVFFHRKFVMQLKWIDDPLYSQLVALAHLLPGPSSSQVGLSIGYLQRGYAGALMAWLGFTLPSAMLMTGIALLGQHYFYILDANSFHTLQLVVFAVIAWAFWPMLNSLCKTAWQYAVVLISSLLLVVILLLSISGLLMALSGPASAPRPNAVPASAIDSVFVSKSAAA